VRSRTEENILRELAVLAQAGYREVVFSGINLSSYGKDTGTTLAEIVEKAAAVPGIARIRLGSLEPDLMDDTSIARMAQVKALCPQFHLSLQSGCTATLRRMRRVYTADEYRTVVQKLRAAFPDATFTTDIIVGFPGETQEEFDETVSFVREIGFLKVHVFSFSRRAGTAAYTMPQQVDEATKAARSRLLQQVADEVRAQVIAQRYGQQTQVLLEKPLNRTLFTGYTREYIPVLVSAPQSAQGDIVTVTLEHLEGDRCRAALLEPAP
jgi:threonylcarbamoyladenosine tRNA methylthiotransferase MtaB